MFARTHLRIMEPRAYLWLHTARAENAAAGAEAARNIVMSFVAFCTPEMRELIRAVFARPDLTFPGKDARRHTCCLSHHRVQKHVQTARVQRNKEEIIDDAAK